MEEYVEVYALMPSSRRAKFAKVASDYAMFFKHEKGGIGGTAKYVDRIYGDVDAEALLIHMDEHGSTARNDQHDVSFRTISGRASGQLVFQAPREPGQYRFRMNETTNDKEVASILFTVEENGK